MPVWAKKALSKDSLVFGDVPTTDPPETGRLSQPDVGPCGPTQASGSVRLLQVHRIPRGGGWLGFELHEAVQNRHTSSEVGMNVAFASLLRAAVALLVVVSPVFGQERPAAKGIPSLADFDDSIEALVRTVASCFCANIAQQSPTKNDKKSEKGRHN